MKAKEKKARTSREKGVAVADNGAATETAAETTTLPEQTEAGREIAQAQEGVELKGKPPMLTNETEVERKKSQDEAHKVSKNAGLRTNIAIGYSVIMTAFAGRADNSVTPEEFIEYRENRLKELPETGNYHRFSYEANGFVQGLFERTQKIVQGFFQGRYDVSLTEVKAKVIEIEKPAPFSMEAELERQADLDGAQKVSENEYRRYGVAVGFRAIKEMFVNDADGSVTPERYRGFRDSRLSKLPADANYFKFTKDANDFVREQKPNLQKELQKTFAGCYDVSLQEVQDELLLIEAEAGMRNDRRRGLKVDEVTAVAVCATDHDTPIRFAAMVWFERGAETGHAFINDRTNEVKAACGECREVGAAHGVQFYPFAVAEWKVKAAKSANATFADAMKKPVSGGNNQSPSGGRRVSDDEKRKASPDVNKFLGGVPGLYYFRHRDWEIPAGVGYEGKRGAELVIESNGKTAKIIDRKSDFGKDVGQEFPVNNASKKLWAFLSQYRNVNRTD